MLSSQCLCFAFTLALIVLPYVYAVCTPNSFLLRAPISQKKYTACPSVSTYRGTVEQCKIETCRLGLNTFNYIPKPRECYIKRCVDGDIMLTTVAEDRLARDVYSLFPACSDAPVVQVKLASDGLASNCFNLVGTAARTVEDCRHAMCEAGGNTFNFNSNNTGSCAMKRCMGGSITYWNRYGGFDVYTTLPCFNDNGGCDHNCSDNGTMTSCSCRFGFTLQSDKKSCQDDDECASNPCHHTCTNTPGSYTCSCRLGYKLGTNQRDCTDIDECDPNQTSCEQQCKNTPGSYICECRDGYRLEGQTGCTNVDECTGDQHDCNQTCTDTVGSYNCSCTDGFVDSQDNKQCHECPDGKYGRDCALQCSDYCAQQSCHPVNGPCNSCRDEFTGEMCQTPPANWTGLAPSLPAIVGGVIAAILVIAVIIVVLVVLWRRGMLPRKGNNSKLDSTQLTKNKPDVVVELSKSNEGLNLGTYPATSTNGISTEDTHDKKDNTSSRKRVNGDNATRAPKVAKRDDSGKIKLSQLRQFIESSKQQDNKILKEQFLAIGQELRGTLNAAEAAPNVKNKFNNILPYDHSITTLQQPDTKGCNYINANYIELDDDKVNYIASQGPQPLTTSDFWKMVWEVNSNLIVMLTNPVELGKRKCDEYWPDTWASYNDVRVTRIKAEEYDEFVRRTFALSVDDVERTLIQYHFTSWPDHGVPNNPTGLLHMLMKVRKDVRPDRHVIVHCSAGVGRTGTFITIDQLLKQADKEGQIDAPSLVNKLRDSRQKMVQTANQYIFIYDAVLEATVLGQTGIPCNEAADLDACRDRMKTQYKFLCSTTLAPSDEQTSDALQPLHVKKNRTMDYLPMNKSIATLKGRSSNETDYINAVFVQGYDKEKFIATQIPLKETMVDFWTLVTDYQCSTIVVLEENKELDKLCSNFLPSGTNSKVTIGQFHVEETNTETLKTATVHTLKILQDVVQEEVVKKATEEPLYRNAKETKNKPQNTDVEPFVTRVIRPQKQMTNVFLVEVFERVQILHRTNHETPILVVCRDAVSVCGLYLGASNVFSRIKQEREVDVFCSVRNIRKSNPYFIVDEAQYLRLLAAAGEYMRTFDTYDNFR